jgi:hypothetical protein
MLALPMRVIRVQYEHEIPGEKLRKLYGVHVQRNEGTYTRLPRTFF